jgi:hypothetical protein
VSSLHHTLGAITVAVNALAAVLGLIAWRVKPLKPFWWSLRGGQALVLVAAVTGAALALDGKTIPRLHLIYGLVPIAVSFVAEQLRLASADIVLQKHDLESGKDVAKLPKSEQHALVAEIIRRETAVMAASAAVVTLLLLRAQGWL